MIVKDHEKKAVGFISVTWITRQHRWPRAGRGWPASRQVAVPGLAAVAISGW